jgi:hypothetical protein
MYFKALSYLLIFSRLNLINGSKSPSKSASGIIEKRKLFHLSFSEERLL